MIRLDFIDINSKLAINLLTKMDESEYSTGYCTKLWMQECALFSDSRCGFLVLIEGEDILVYSPIVLETKKKIFRKGIVVADSLPFDALGGIFFGDLSKKEIGNALDMFLSMNHNMAFNKQIWLATRIKTLIELKKFQQYTGLVTSKGLSSSTFAVLDLPNTTNELEKKYHSRHRKNLDLAIKSGINVRKYNKEKDLLDFYSLIKITMNRVGKKIPVILPFLLSCGKKIIENKNGNLYLAEVEERIVAGVFIVSNHKKSYYWLGGMDHNDKTVANKQPTYFLLDTAFKDAVNNGHTIFELGGTPNEGLARFKQGWGAKQEKYVYLDIRNPSLNGLNSLYYLLKQTSRKYY